MLEYELNEKHLLYCLVHTPDLTYVNVRAGDTFHFIVDMGKFVLNFPASPTLPEDVEVTYHPIIDMRGDPESLNPETTVFFLVNCLAPICFSEVLPNTLIEGDECGELSLFV